GQFLVTKTDLVLPGRLPVIIQRRYRSGGSRVGPLGIGWALEPYDNLLTTAGGGLSQIQADQGSYRLSPNALGVSGQFSSAVEPFLRGAVVTQITEADYDIRFKDGTVHRYNQLNPFRNAAALSAIIDRN